MSSRSASGNRSKIHSSTSMRNFKQRLSKVFRLWAEDDYDAALGEVEMLIKVWPGNAQLHILWASLVQLQEEPTHTLEEAKQALQQAMDLDKSSPSAAIELGHFLDTVEDAPQAAIKVYAEAAASARLQLIEALVGQAKALLQLDKREEALKCLRELLYLTEAASALRRSKHGSAFALKESIASQLEELVNEALLNHSA